MSDVKKTTRANRTRRRAEDDRAARKRKNTKRQAVCALYLVAGACAGAAGCFASAGIVFGSLRAWGSLIVAAGIALITLWFAVIWDDEETGGET